MDADRTRAGQYNLTLKRDTVADLLKYPQSLKAQIRKGIITNLDSPYLCNRETDILVNEIKGPNEIYLKDDTRVPWLVLYLKKGVLGTNDQANIVNIPPLFQQADYEISTSIEQWAYYQYVQGTGGVDALVGSNFDFACCYNDYNHPFTQRRSYTNERDRFNNYTGGQMRSMTMIDKMVNTNLDITRLLIDEGDAAVKASLDSSFDSRTASMITAAQGSFGLLNNTAANDLDKYDGKIIKDSSNKYYQVKKVRVKSEQKKYVLKIGEQTTLFTLMTNAWNSGTARTDSPNNSSLGVQINVEHFRLTIDEVPASSVEINLGACQLKTEDSPLFDAICMPFGNMTYMNPGEYLYTYTTGASRSMQILNAIATQLTSSKAFDLQILPYCPINIVASGGTTLQDVGAYMFDEGKMFIGSAAAVGMQCIEHFQGGGFKAEEMIFVAKSMNRTFDIQQQITKDDFKYINTIEDDAKKVKYTNDCTKLRLCSPNYNGVFEFNLAKNGMIVSGFNVDMTLRPYNPYIHVNPNFDKLYGVDTDDQRGLICQGDFSLGTLDSAWAQYELQNRNYQTLFDRQIQNLDVNQDVQMMNAAFQAVGGTITGGAAGAAMGAKAGPYGAIAGAAVGTVLGGVGGALDVWNTDRLQKEQRSYMKDNYALQLGNVRALPNCITKTSALTLNNKFWPFIEMYECTEEEKEAYINKITYDGMSIGIIDTLDHWVTFNKNIDKLQYLQCRLIRNPNAIAIENHELDDLNNELMKGIYI